MNFDWNLILKRLVGAMVWAVALAIGAWSIAVSTGIMGAFLGGFTGFLVGPILARTRLRTPTILGGGLLVGLVVGWLCGLPARAAWLAGLFGPELAYGLSDGAAWFSGCLVFVAALHAATVRHGAFLAVELAVVAVALVTPLSAHRDGYINRPHFFVDVLWSNGWDPVPFLMAVGALTAATLLVLSVGRFNRRNTLADLALLLVLASFLAMFLPLNRLQQLAPEQQEPLGLQGEAREKGDPPPPMDGKPRDGKDGEGGKKDEPNPEDGGSQGKPSPVALVLFHDDFTPADGYYYFRQKVFSMFNGSRLVDDTTGFADKDVPMHFPSAGAEEDAGVGIVPEKMEPDLTKSVHTTVHLIVSHTLPFGLLNPVSMKSAPNPDPSQFLRAYDVVSTAFVADLSVLMGRKAGNPAWTPELREHYLRMPDDPRYKELADKILGRLNEKYRQDPLARAVMIKLWLETEGTYSLKVKVLDSDDAVARFLFGDIKGYCVHFAHSAAYLLRASGIPSRVATGYAVDARYRYEGSALLIQDMNSHAWAEIYLDGIGWVPLDVAPQRSEAGPPPAPDADLQRMLGQLARKQAPNPEGKPQEKKSLTDMLRVGLELLGKVLGVAGVLLVIGLYAVKIGRRVGPYVGTDEFRVKRTFRAALDRLADVGVTRRWGQTRESFALGLRESHGALSSLTELHMRAALGDPGVLQNPAREDVLKLYGDLGRQIARQTPWWRRLLGSLNPFSWLLVR